MTAGTTGITRTSAERSLPTQRRHTQLFLEQIRDFSPVFLDTDVDATALVAARARAAEQGRRLSVVTLVVHAAAGVLAAHPDANAAVAGIDDLRLVRYDCIAAKVTLDKRFAGERVVLATVVPDPQGLGIDDVQRWIDDAAGADPDTDDRFAHIRVLRALPADVARERFRAQAADLATRPAVTGTFSVTSLGHGVVDGFHSVGGTTITLGVGRIVDRPVARDGAVVVAPVLRLSLSFDHRVIDGAEAADVLGDVAAALESVALESVAPESVRGAE